MVGSEPRVPTRGDIVWITLSPQAGRRPALVLSPAAYNGKVGLAILCPITSQVKSLDWRERKAEVLCSLPGTTVDEVLDRLGTLLSRQEA